MATWKTRIQRLWDFMIRPHPSLTDVEHRRQSRLLAIILIVTLAVSGYIVIAEIGRMVTNVGGSDSTLILIPLQFVMIGVYSINRSGRYELAALLFVVLSFAAIHLVPPLADALDWLFYASMVMIQSAILMPTGFTIGLFIASLVAQLGIAAFRPMEIYYTNFGVMSMYIVTSSLIIAFVVYRNGLERERQAEIQETNRRLRESEIELERRVEQRTRELQQAKEIAESARARAEQLDRVKSQFLASMSHELRTPLNAILSFNELMMMGTFGEVTPEQVEYLGKSLSSGRHLLSLINDVLDITKIHSGMMKLFVEDDFNPTAELNQVKTATEKLLGDKPVQMTLEIAPNLPLMRVDKRRIRQVLYNLVSNAVKFTERGSIAIRAERQADDVLLAVIDTGPGIAPEMHTLIFEPFVQTETGIKHAGGTGLGLPISKSLVEAHGGRLWVESAIGHGSAFYVRLPLDAGLPLGEYELDRSPLVEQQV